MVSTDNKFTVGTNYEKILNLSRPLKMPLMSLPVRTVVVESPQGTV